MSTSDPDTGDHIVYIVTDGCYSDYHIVAAFDNLPAAEACVRRRAGDDCSVEEYTLNNTQPITRHYFAAKVGAGWASDSWGGRVDRANEHSADAWVTEGETDDWVSTRQGYPRAWYWTPQQRLSPEGDYYAEAVAHDADTAVKIGRDLLAQLKYEHATSGTTELPIRQEQA